MTVGFALTTKSNGTISIDFAQSEVDRLNELSRGETATFDIELTNETDRSLLYDFEKFAGKYTIVETLDGKQNYKQFIPSGATVDSLLVSIEPDAKLTGSEIRGVYGLVSSVSDIRPSGLNTSRASIELDVLAPIDEYLDRQTAEDNLNI